MKKLIVFLAIMLMAGTAWASPFLVCDCQDDVEQYVLIFDGGTPIIVDAIDGSGTDVVCTGAQKRLSFDVAPLALTDGQHTVEGAAKNLWAESTYVPLDFNKAVPSSGTGIGLSVSP